MHHITPIIVKQNGKRKAGQGFSPDELKAAGISKQQAQQLKIRIDMRRKSSHQENIDTIKAHTAKPKA